MTVTCVLLASAEASLSASPRDPRATETLQSFAKAVDWAKSGRFTQQDIDEAKLSVFSAVDAPVAPSDRGIGSKSQRAPPYVALPGRAREPLSCVLLSPQLPPSLL